jgi:hypothetical protein
MLISGLFMCCNCKEEPPPYDVTGFKEDLHPRKLRLLSSPPSPPNQDSLAGVATTENEAVVRGKMVATWAPPYPDAVEKTNLV